MNFINYSLKEDNQFIGIQYNATGIFGYSFRTNDNNEVFNISSIITLNPDIHMIGFNKELVHKKFDLDITLIPGVRRTFTDSFGNITGYYEYKNCNEFYIIIDTLKLSVKSYEDNWDVSKDSIRFANIYKIPNTKSNTFEEHGYEMKTRYLINISKETDYLLYPYIMSIPILGF